MSVWVVLYVSESGATTARGVYSTYELAKERLVEIVEDGWGQKFVDSRLEDGGYYLGGRYSKNYYPDGGNASLELIPMIIDEPD